MNHSIQNMMIDARKTRWMNLIWIPSAKDRPRRRRLLPHRHCLYPIKSKSHRSPKGSYVGKGAIYAWKLGACLVNFAPERWPVCQCLSSHLLHIARVLLVVFQIVCARNHLAKDLAKDSNYQQGVCTFEEPERDVVQYGSACVCR